jgi:hypothetical protein
MSLPEAFHAVDPQTAEPMNLRLRDDAWARNGVLVDGLTEIGSIV